MGTGIAKAADGVTAVGVPTTKGQKMDEDVFFTDEDDFEMWGDEDYQR